MQWSDDISLANVAAAERRRQESVGKPWSRRRRAVGPSVAISRVLLTNDAWIYRAGCSVDIRQLQKYAGTSRRHKLLMPLAESQQCSSYSDFGHKLNSIVNNDTNWDMQLLITATSGDSDAEHAEHQNNGNEAIGSWLVLLHYFAKSRNTEIASFHWNDVLLLFQTLVSGCWILKQEN